MASGRTTKYEEQDIDTEAEIAPRARGRHTSIAPHRVDEFKQFADPRGPALLRRLLRAKDKMDAASQDAWTVRQLAAVSGVSEAHFARAFKVAFGLPPHRYLLTRRIERAKSLLRDTKLPIIDIVYSTGWESLGTFGRVFRDITGESPTEFRTRESADPNQLDRVPHCFVSAAYRPDLTIAVSEKRRQAEANSNAADERRLP